MLRILAFFLIVLAAAIGFSWLADNPGEVSLLWQGSEIRASFMVFVIAQLLLLTAVVLVVWLIRLFLKSPDRIGGYFRRRSRDRGYQALSSGIIAAGAGDTILARRMTKRTEKLLRDQREPLVRFLDAQTAMIEGDHPRARSAFEAMERDPETRLLALRGLFLEAERTGDTVAARSYAERAVKIAPHVPWAGGAVLEAKSLAGDWDGALEILEAQKNSRLIDSAESKRRRAVLLTAKAIELGDGDPAGSRSAAIEAQKLAPDLTPATVTAARALFRLGDLRRGSKVLERGWTEAPHPDIAATYIHARPGDSPEDRLKRARVLYDLRPTHVESDLALAQAALEAKEFALARKHALAAIASEPRESAFLLMADIEEEETGEIGRVREWLGRAIRAPRDPAWTADGVVAREWAPVSPVSGRLDAFQWKVPVERVGGDTLITDAAHPSIALDSDRLDRQPDDAAADDLVADPGISDGSGRSTNGAAAAGFSQTSATDLLETGREAQR
ncbi:heme biosynthesis protein HemY [Mangrovicella endophytica]|uniref:heme biosynthesis protein HemY n=1 Tax=Mangrovicella endophytica TaxID=2066697 RepID=UPI000C9DD5C1|nr:heme biosynthesis HemY N-terminal domain-containing protein [Mangrovicella endophytica]